MPEDDNEGTAAFTEDVQASPHKLRADALPLAIRQDGRRQSHPDDTSPRALDHRRGKEDMAHDRAILSHQ
jgi:hypothetical protein